MARIPYVDRETIPDGRTDLFDRLIAVRGRAEHIFLALANAPDLTEGVLGMATALRTRTALPKPFRELAVVTVGLETGAAYEVEHHRNAALAVGVRAEQLDRLREFETADCFSEQERAVIRLAKEMTVSGPVKDSTWDAVGFLGDRQRLELVVTVAWYNCVVRIILPLQLELEPWHVRQG